MANFIKYFKGIICVTYVRTGLKLRTCEIAPFNVYRLRTQFCLRIFDVNLRLLFSYFV